MTDQNLDSSLKDTPPENVPENSSANYIQSIVLEDFKKAPAGYQIHTRFPPEPNGYLHIGHAKSICLNFGTAQQFGGVCNLRFDDTNPSKEEVEFVDSIQEDIRWLGFDWEDRCFYASDYFALFYQYALDLIREGKAFVCDLTPEEMREYRGTLTEPGKNSPYRERSIDENLDLFTRMKDGEFPDGARVLRAKIDMTSPNINMRDPVIYRIQRSHHHRTGDAWCIYPMYDFAHPLSDALEDITHSVCTLEFADHRPLYDWAVNHVPYQNKTNIEPHQYEFARLNLSYTVMSKRKLRRLVEENYVSGWDDPRMPTISGLRRRGYTAAALRDFCERIGVARRDSMVDIALLEHCLREELNQNADRIMAVLDPIKVVLTNYPEGQTEWLPAENNPADPESMREIPFSRELYIDAEDFMLDPPKKFFRLRPGGEVRLKHAYIIQCQEVIQDENGNITELLCTYDPTSKSGGETAGRKIKGTLHWVSAPHAADATVNLYDHLFTVEAPDAAEDYLTVLNPKSLTVMTGCKIEPSVLTNPAPRFQFLRQGYFMRDKGATSDQLIFNRIVALKDTWAKIKTD